MTLLKGKVNTGFRVREDSVKEDLFCCNTSEKSAELVLQTNTGLNKGVNTALKYITTQNIHHT